MSRRVQSRKVGRETARGGSIGVSLLCLLVFASMFVDSEGGPAPVDAVLLLLVAHVAASASQARLGKEFGRALGRLAMAVLLFIAISTFSIVLFGGDPMRLLIDAVSFAYLLVPLFLLSTAIETTRMAWLFWVGALCAALFALATLGEQSIRGTGFMSNPNMAAAWMGLAFLVICSKQTGLPRVVRLSVGFLVALALLATDSYSAAIGLLLAFAYLMATHRHRLPSIALATGAVMVVWLFREDLFSRVAEPDRLASSSGSRSRIWSAAWETWKQNPMGIGHGSFVQDQVYGGGVQTHNDYLTALVEQGIVGLAVLLFLGLMVYRMGGRLTRAAMVFVAVSAFFHDVLNFRHIWIFMAVAIALDIRERRIDRDLGNLKCRPRGIDDLSRN